MKYMKISLDIS